ncbi:MAG TPA: hypothetical protein VN914_06255 [Polyangia bacterium]|nr:hypothetical protein [Polyangia bacterium]
MTAGSRVAATLSTFDTIKSLPPPARKRPSTPEARRAKVRSPCPGAYSEGRPSAPTNSSASGVRRTDTNWVKVSTGTRSVRPASPSLRTASAVAKLAMR